MNNNFTDYADEFGNFIYLNFDSTPKALKQPISSTDENIYYATEGIKIYNKYNAENINKLNEILQHNRLLYYCYIGFIPGIESAIEKGAILNNSSYSEDIISNLMDNINTGKTNVNVLEILKILLDKGFTFNFRSSDENNKMYDFQQIVLEYGPILYYISGNNRNILLNENNNEMLNKLIKITLRGLKINKMTIKRSYFNSDNNFKNITKLLNDILDEPKLASEQVDVLTTINNRANPFHGPGPRDLVMSYLTESNYLLPHERFESKPRKKSKKTGGKRKYKTNKRKI